MTDSYDPDLKRGDPCVCAECGKNFFSRYPDDVGATTCSHCNARQGLDDAKARHRIAIGGPILDGLRYLARSDADRASEQNDIGFSKLDSDLGHALAEKEGLTVPEQKIGKKMLEKYRKQLNAELYIEVINFEPYEHAGLEDEEEKGNQSETAWESIKECFFFTDGIGNEYVTLENIPVPVRSATFRRAISGLLFAKSGKIANSQVIKNIELLAAFEAAKNEVDVGVRVAWVENGECMVYDPLNKDGSVLEIQKTGIVKRIPERPYTVRWTGMKHADIEEGTIDDLNQLVDMWRLAENGEDGKKNANAALFKGSLGCTFIPGFPHCLLFFTGHHGAAKTGLSAVVINTADPNEVPFGRLPTDPEQLILNASHQWISGYDNINSSISSQISDTLCRLVTGEGNRKRALYTDTDQSIQRVKRVIVANGINMPIVADNQGQDLADRILGFSLQEIEDGIRLTEGEVELEVSRLLPKVRGYILSLIPRVMTSYDAILSEHKGRLPRMADAAVWGEAFAREMGEEPDVFFNAFLRNQKRELIATIEDTVLFKAIRTLIPQENDTLEGNATQLLESLRGAPGLSDEDKKELPRDATRLSGKLNKIAKALKALGISISEENPTGSYKKKVIRNIGRENKGSTVEEKNVDGKKEPAGMLDTICDRLKEDSVSSVREETGYLNSTNKKASDATKEDSVRTASDGTIASDGTTGPDSPESSAGLTLSDATKEDSHRTVPVCEKNGKSDAKTLYREKHPILQTEENNTDINSQDTNFHAKDTVSEIMRFVMKRVQPSEHPSVRDKNNIIRLINAEFKTGPGRAKTLVGMWIASGVLLEDGQDRWLLLPGPKAQEALQ